MHIFNGTLSPYNRYTKNLTLKIKMITENIKLYLLHKTDFI